MAVIAAATARTNSQPAALAAEGIEQQVSPGDAPPKPGTTAESPAVTVMLSDGARSLLNAQAADPALFDMPSSFEELVTRRTEELAGRLVDAFAKMGIPADEEISFRIGRSGAIEVDSPYKKKIEKMLEEDPELAEELKTVATLNALRAAEEILRLQTEELRSATTEEEKDAARSRHLFRSMDIQTLSGSMTLKDGELTSAALKYADLLSGPEAAAPDEKAETRVKTL